METQIVHTFMNQFQPILERNLSEFEGLPIKLDSKQRLIFIDKFEKNNFNKLIDWNTEAFCETIENWIAEIYPQITGKEKTALIFELEFLETNEQIAKLIETIYSKNISEIQKIIRLLETIIEKMEITKTVQPTKIKQTKTAYITNINTNNNTLTTHIIRANQNLTSEEIKNWMQLSDNPEKNNINFNKPIEVINNDTIKVNNQYYKTKQEIFFPTLD